MKMYWVYYLPVLLIAISPTIATNYTADCNDPTIKKPKYYGYNSYPAGSKFDSLNRGQCGKQKAVICPVGLGFQPSPTDYIDKQGYTYASNGK
jgi:hypothetical protein